MKRIKIIIVILLAFSAITTFAQSFKYVSGNIECYYRGRWKPITEKGYVLRGSDTIRSPEHCFIVKNAKTNEGYYCAPTTAKGGKLVDLIKIKCQQVRVPNSGIVTEVPKGKEVSDAVKQQIIGNFPVNFHYFLVGIHDFQDQHWKKLQDPTDNFEKFAEAIEHKLIPDNNYMLSMHDVLTGVGETYSDVILRKLKNLSDSVKFHNNDMVLIFLSSHGMYDSKTDNFQFITTDSQISADTLNAYINEMTAKGAEVLVFVDACQSGAVVKGINSMDGDGKCVYFMSCEEDENSYEPINTAVTPFAKALINSVSGEELQFVNKFSTNVVTPVLLKNNITDFVREEYKDKSQYPLYHLNNIEKNEPLWIIKPDIIDSLKYQANNLNNYCAMVQLGDIYYYNYKVFGVSQDTVTALKYYRSAYNAVVNPMAACRLGMHYFYQSPKPDYDKAFSLFEESAEKDCDLGRYYLSVCYDKGKGVKANRAKAKHYFKQITYWNKDLKQAYNKEKVVFLTHSLSSLGGPNRPITTIKAFKLNNDTLIFNPGDIDRESFDVTLELAREGNAESQAKVGDMYLYGKILPIGDYQRAFYWYNESAAKGDKNGLFGMGVLYMNGLGVEKDYRKAADYFIQSAEKGKTYAYTKLGSLYYSGGYGVTSDTARAIEYWQKAAQLKDVNGLYMLGLCYKDGIGVPKDLDKAYSCFYKCAKKGHVKSQCQLGMLFHNDDFSQRDLQQSEKWLKLAIKQGDVQALEFYNIHFNDGCPARN